MLLRLAGGARAAASPSLVTKTTTASRSNNNTRRAAAAAMSSSDAAAPAALPPPTAHKQRLPAPVGAPTGAWQGGLSLDPSAYPLARRDEAAGDVLHGVFCPDPYRHLEDPDAAETAAFVEAQNAVADKVLKSGAVAQLRAPFKALFERLYDYPRFSAPFKRGDSYYYYHNSGLQPQSVLYRAGGDPEAPHSESAAFLDPNALSADGTVALRDVSFSEDGALAAYSLSDGGSDWSVIRVVRAADDDAAAGGAKRGDALPDVLRRVKFSSIAWTTDGLGFFYCRYDVGGGPPPSKDEEEAKEAVTAKAAADGPAPAAAAASPAAAAPAAAPAPTAAKDYDGTEVERLSGQRLYYHALGDAQERDALVWEDPTQPDWMWGAECTEDGRFLALHVSEGCQPRNRLYVLDLAAHVPRRQGAAAAAGGEASANAAAAAAAADGPYDFSAWPARSLPFARVVDDFEGSYDVVANEGSVFYLRTNRGAPRYKMVKVDVAPALAAVAKAVAGGGGGKADGGAAAAAAATGLAPADDWTEVIPQHPKDVLQGVVALKGDLAVARWLRDCVSGLELRALTTGCLLRPLPLPSLGDVGAVSGTRKSAELFFSFTSFVEPGATFRLRDAADPSNRPPELFRATALSVAHDPNDYVTERLFATSKDGTRVPLFVTRHKTVALDGASPCLLYGYGGFTISLSATFSPSRLAWMRGFRGVFAQANLRGGGEYGTGWRDAGSVLNKQNVFDDFCACAEALVEKGYAAEGKVAIQGGSNGGLLVAACLNQRPDLFGAGVAQVGVMDMLRFQRFTIGHAWVSDYGSAEKSEEEFQALSAYSPLHNVALPRAGQGQYPAVVLATGDHDDRVVPLHSLKLLAALQHAAATAGGGGADGRGSSPQRNPIIGRIEVRAGHGAGKPTAKVIEETSDLLAFAAAAVGAAWHEEEA